MLVRPFRESALEVVGWIDDQEVPVFKYGTSNILSSRYWQVSDNLRDLTDFFSVLPHGHLLGLSLDSPTLIPAKDESDDESGDVRVQKYITAMFDVLMRHTHLLTDVHSLYIYSLMAIDLRQLLDELPDLRNLLVWGCSLDISFMRHANLEWLGIGAGDPVDGLELASLPALRGVEFDNIPMNFMESLQHARFPKLDHFGVTGWDGCELTELFAHDAFPKKLNSLYVDSCHMVCFGEDILQYAGKSTLKHLTIRGVYLLGEELYIETHFPMLEHFGILDDPEHEDTMCANEAVHALSHPLLPKGITSLDLHGVNLGDADMRVLLGLPLLQQLKYLNITYHNVEDATLLEQITALRLNGCTVVGVKRI